MKTEDLMIGDIVTFEDCQHDENPVVIKIWQINQDGDAFVSIDNDETLDEINIDNEVVGLPLTPEILEKNGFKQNGIPNSVASIKEMDWCDDTYVWSRQETPDERMFVSVYMDDPANFFVEVYCQYCHSDGIHVKYLHELQHALRLCGIEKTIEL